MSESSPSGSNNLTFPGKIAIITNPPSVNEDDFHSPDRLLEKYGEEKIIHLTWPEDFMIKRNKVIDTVAALAEDKDIIALIINQAIEGSNDAIDKLKETRDDIFIIYCNTNEIPSRAASHANLIMGRNELSMGYAIVKQAKKQGAKVFVHYTFPRHMAMALLAGRRDLIRETCAAEGIQYVEAITPDPAGEAGISNAQNFLTDDVPKLVAKYGEDTAFFSTNCQLQIPLIKAVINSHAIFPQPCCPSPYHGFPEALGLEVGCHQIHLNRLIAEACRIAEEKNMSDRLSTWPVSMSMMFTNAGAEYAIRWINGEVPKDFIDEDALMDCMNTYIMDTIGEESCVFLDPYSDGKTVYQNYKLVLMSYLDF